MVYTKWTSIRKSHTTTFIILTIVLVGVFLLSFALGRFPVTPVELIKVFVSKVYPLEPTWQTEVETVVFQIRLPRIFAAIVIGTALSCAGATYQGLFQNPMVSPDLLGASAGAGFGAALAIFLGLNKFGVSTSAFFLDLSLFSSFGQSVQELG